MSTSDNSNPSNMTNDDTIMHDHPLYLHQTDNPGLILISKKLTGSDNYGINSDTRALSERNNDMIISWILNVVTEQISNNLNFVSFASKLWSEFQEYYYQIDGHRIYQLTHDLIQLKQLNCVVEVYYQKLKGRENVERDQRKRLIQFLMGLDKGYSNIRGQILLMYPLPTVVKAYGMVRHEEKQREGILYKPNTPAIFSTFSNNPRNYTNQNYTCQRNFSRGETSNSTERRSVFKKGLYYGNCSKEGHTKAECYKIVGYPTGHPLYGKFPAKQTPKSTNDSRKYRTVNKVMGQNEQMPMGQPEKNEGPSGSSHQHQSIPDSHASDKRIALDSLCNGLYLLNKEPTSLNPLHTAFTLSSKQYLWHSKLGHSSPTVLKQIKCLSSSFPFNSNLHCTICPLAKHHSLLFHESKSYASNLFELVHIDVWGPYRHTTINKCKYFLIIVDDHSRATWTYLMPSKNHAISNIKTFYFYILNHFKTTIKTIWSDNGTEFLNSSLSDFFSQHGIIHQTICPYTPQQNARVERKHKQLLEIARELKLQANFPIHFWGYCILAATYIINRLPSRAINNKSPVELLYNKPPSLDNLKVIGYRAHVHQNTTNKFENKAIPAVLVGYSNQQKRYILYDPKTHKTTTSRHVTFDENIFPFHITPQSTINHPNSPSSFTPIFIPQPNSPLTPSTTPSTASPASSTAQSHPSHSEPITPTHTTQSTSTPSPSQTSNITTDMTDPPTPTPSPGPPTPTPSPDPPTPTPSPPTPPPKRISTNTNFFPDPTNNQLSGPPKPTPST
ncbi:retrovirus-related pol polyprotein from transposon TNT 1-94 [Tanacetum coccineum]|uniref:Retrovirus-related pol polyprotein from transposon TNT 1-94 n=1 Tax=Tanacetum coccineum TaxID=301880 RepID=A0ABQ5FG95_9ASTR